MRDANKRDGNGDCCKPWCWVSEEDCPTARYNKEADKFYSYDACGATCAGTTTAERKSGIKTSNLGTSCESEYRNAWVKYRMATWIFILPLFCLVSSLCIITRSKWLLRIYIIIEITEAGRRIKCRRKRNGEVIILVCRINPYDDERADSVCRWPERTVDAAT